MEGDPLFFSFLAASGKRRDRSPPGWSTGWNREGPMRASLFITCYNDTLFPETGRAVVMLLERLGVDLQFDPQQTCCGQMHANTGFRGEAFSQAERFVHLYQDAETVVIPSSSCVAMIREQY